MASIRLTNDMRGEICKNAMDHRFKPEVAGMVKEFAALAEAAYQAVFGDIRERMESLPKGWLPRVQRAAYKFGASYVTLDYDGDFPSRYHNSGTANLVDLVPGNTKEVWRLVTEDKRGVCHHVFDARHTLSETYDALVGRAKDLDTLVAATRADLSATLGKFTTVEKLLEAWPEIEPFTKGVTPTPKNLLPMVPVSKLNDALGLPVE